MKQKKWPFMLFLILLAAGIAGSLFMLRKPAGRQVEIVRDGEVLYSFNLEEAEDQTIEIEYEGRKNTVEIQGRRIRMAEAECPDQTCVEMGWLDSAAPIVCLPNHLTIRFTENTGEVDAVAG